MEENPNLTDEEIVEKVRSTDRDLYVIVIERYKNKLLKYAANLVHDEDIASHIVQDSFIKAYINLNGFNIRKKFSSWIYRIVHNEAINFVKKSNKEIRLPEDFDFESGQDINKEYEEKETSLYVGKCLKLMPITYSEPLSLFYLDQKSYEEISDILRISIGTVAMRMNRARKLMRHICQKR